MPVTYGTPPTQINSASPDTFQNYSTVADIPGLGYVLLWQGPGYNTTFPFETGIFGQCYNYAGEKIGNQFQVTASNTTGYLSDADVTAAANGTFTVTWSGPDGSFPGIFMRSLFFGGSYAGAATQVNTATDGSQEYSQVTHLANGNTLVTWQSTGNAPGVFARLYDSFHQPLGDQFKVNSSPAGFVAAPSVTGDVSGGFVIVWQDAPGTNDTDVRMQRFGVDGSRVGPEILMSSIDHGAAHNPVITTLTNGTYVVAWDVGPPGYVGSEIIAQRFGLNGEKLGDEVQVTAGAEYTGHDPAIVATTDGGFAITYESGSQVMLRTFNSQGQAVGDPWPIADDQNSLQFEPDIAQLGDGSFIVTWGGNDVFFERFHVTDYLREGNLTEDDDRAMGSSVSDYLEGFGGNDTLRGGEGDDILEGGLGADRMIGGAGRDEVTYANATGAISLNLQTGSHGGEAQGDTFEEIEQISLTRYNDRVVGGDLDDVLYGLGGDDNLSGGAGINRLDGGDGNDLLEGGVGTDILIGGDGFDEVTYVHSSFGLSVDLLTNRQNGAAAGDTFSSIEKFTLSRFFDEFRGTDEVDRVSGGIGNDILFGRGGNDLLDGNDGNDELDGGAGADQLTGGYGDDLYYVDHANDLVLEFAFAGNDRVVTSVSYGLAAGQSVETLEAAAAGAGVPPINLSGNEFANTLIGNDGGNTLDGRGGIDTMIGKGGDDMYYVDSSLDQIVETAGQGTDRVFASTSYTLGAGVDVEMLTTDFHSGTRAINLTGNGIANVIYGNDGANVLNGGAGADTLVGRLGDDMYFVDNAGDRIVETAGQGSDRAFAAASYTLEAGASVEMITTADNAGTTAINLTGNELANTIYGNDGANILDGKGGADVLIGRAGGDFFSFTSALGGGNVDQVIDFSSADDTIQLDHAVFAGMGGLGALDPNAFVTGAAAGDANDRIVYNAATGQLFFDADGNGAGAMVMFATLQGAPSLNASDFLVI